MKSAPGAEPDMGRVDLLTDAQRVSTLKGLFAEGIFVGGGARPFVAKGSATLHALQSHPALRERGVSAHRAVNGLHDEVRKAAAGAPTGGATLAPANELRIAALCAIHAMCSAALDDRGLRAHDALHDGHVQQADAMYAAALGAFRALLAHARAVGVPETAEYHVARVETALSCYALHADAIAETRRGNLVSR